MLGVSISPQGLSDAMALGAKNNKKRQIASAVFFVENSILFPKS